MRLVPHAGDWRAADVVRRRGRAEPAAVRAARDATTPARCRSGVVRHDERRGRRHGRQARRGRRRRRRPRLRDGRARGRERDPRGARHDDRAPTSGRTRSRRSSCPPTSGAVVETDLLEIVVSSTGTAGSFAAVSATNGAGTSTKPWDAPRLAAGARPRQRDGRPDARGRAARPLPRAQQPARRMGAGAGVDLPARGSPAAALLRFDGRRPRGDGLLDGEQVAEHESAFRPLDVPGRRAASTCSRSCSTRRRRASRRWVARARARAQEPRMGYGWDFCPRLVHQGIWRPVELLDEPRVPAEPRATPRVELRDDYTLLVDGEPPRSGAGTGVPSTRSTGCRGPRSSRTCSSSRRAANVNLLRVWGGGLIETDEFYDALRPARDPRLAGVRQSSSGIESVPSDDPAVRRARWSPTRAPIVPRLRHHPSLAVWCGGNELDGDDSTTARSRRCARSCDELDPGRAWLPTSPLGRRDAARPLGAPGPARALRALRRRATHRLHSEFGVEGMTNRARARGADRGGRALARRPLEPGLRASRRLVEQRAARQEAFGGRIADVETMRAPASGCSTTASATQSRRTSAAARARSRGSSTSRIRTRGARRRSTGTASRSRRTTASRAPTAARRARSSRPARGAARARCGCARRRPRVRRPRRHASSPRATASSPRRSTRSPRRLRRSTCTASNRYVMTRTADLAPLLDLPRAGSSSRSNDAAAPRPGVDRARGRARGCGGPARDGSFSDNVLDLLPGEERESCSRAGRRAAVEGWNARASALAPDGSPVEGFSFDGDARSRGAAPSRSTPGSASSSSSPPTDEPQLARAGRLLRREPARELHAHLSALHAGQRRRRADGVGRVVVPRRPLRDAGGVRARRRARHDARRARSGSAGVGFALRDGRPVVWLDFPYREEPLRYDGSRDAGAAGRADASLAARRARRARRSRARRRPAACARGPTTRRSTIRAGSRSRRRRRSRRTASTAGTTGPIRRG